MPTTTTCTRCARPCQIAPLSGAPGRLLTRSPGPTGLCPNCAMTAFLHSTDLARLLTQTPDGPRALLLPHIQEQCARLLAVGQAQAQPEELDWPTIVAQWDLPLPTTRRRLRHQDGPQRGARSA